VENQARRADARGIGTLFQTKFRRCPSLAQSWGRDGCLVAFRAFGHAVNPKAYLQCSLYSRKKHLHLTSGQVSCMTLLAVPSFYGVTAHGGPQRDFAVCPVRKLPRTASPLSCYRSTSTGKSTRSSRRNVGVVWRFQFASRRLEARKRRVF
jgi:hypothetical protein